MNPLPTRLVVALALVLALASVQPAAAAVADGLTLEVLVDGVPLTEHHARGATYVEARPGAEYSLRIANRTPHRVAVALAVDGLNTVDARTTTAREARKWVLDPWQTVVLDGWQTGVETARRFVFTSERESYGAWLGRTANLGVIEAVVFRERRPRPALEVEEQARRSGEAAAPGAAGRERLSDAAATGIGREVDHPVVSVRLDLEPDPCASLRLRYEYRPELVRLGVLPSDDPVLDRREAARGFAGGFCPDPYRGG